MATSAFKSTTKRSSITSPSTPTTTRNDDSSSINRANSSHRRSRSLNRFSGRFTDSDDVPVPRGRFVNTERGSGFPEMSLDDLVNEFFPFKDSDEREIIDSRGRSARRSSSIGPSMAETSITRRGRSVSRPHASTGDRKNLQDSNLGNKSFDSSRRGRSVSRQNTQIGNQNGIGRNSIDNRGIDNSRRRRSLSVAKYQISDSESDHSIKSKNHENWKSFRSVNDQRSSIHKPAATNPQPVLRRSISQRDFTRSRDGYSSQSSALTDDESRDARSSKNETERTIRAVYAQKKTEHPTGDEAESGLYEVMRKELRYAVHEIRTELEQVMVPTKTSALANSDLQTKDSKVLQAVSLIRENYATQLEQSAKRKQDLLAEIVVEEQRGRELSMIVKDLLPDPKSTDVPQKPVRARKRSNDRSRMSKCLSEEAEKYFEDFLSNVEDTDISSLDGERSDASSKLGGRKKLLEPVKMRFESTENFETPIKSTSVNSEMDGVVLPWLEWETSICKPTQKVLLTPENTLPGAAQEMSVNESNSLISGRGSWSPAVDSPYVISRDITSSRNSEANSKKRESWFDMDEYLQLQQNESSLFENWRQRNRINSGGLLLCHRNYL